MKENNISTFETLPTTIKVDQFYYYNKKTGEVGLGEIVGTSALSTRAVLRVGKCEFTTHWGFSYNFRTLTLNRDFKCFLDYQTFSKDYNKYKAEQEVIKAARRRTARYIVDKNSYFCRRSFCKSVPYGFKEFGTKAEAIECSEKGLVQLKKYVEKYLPLLRELMKDTQEAKKEIFKVLEMDKILGTRLYDLKPKSGKIKVGDVLFKVGIYNVGNQYMYYHRIIPEFLVSVSSIISKDIAKLSDGTLLIQSENSDVLFDCGVKNDVEKVIINGNFEELIRALEQGIITLERIEGYCKKYKPLDTCVVNVYVNKQYTTDLYNSGTEILRVIKSDAENLHQRLEKYDDGK